VLSRLYHRIPLNTRYTASNRRGKLVRIDTKSTLRESSTPMPPINYQFSRRKIGQLNCGVVHPQSSELPIASLALFLHGYGAGGDDLVPLAQELLRAAELDQATMLVFPEAPLSLEELGMPGARAWWMLSIQRLLSAIENGQYELVRQEEPAGIDDAREMLSEVIRLLLEETNLTASNLLLSGFSQGAMLSTDVACRGLETPPAALALFSGCMICERVWKPNMQRLRETKILQSHGSVDSILPLQTGKWLTEALQQANCEVEFIEFYGDHTIPPEAIRQCAQLLKEITNGPQSV
ncbi:MAG: hypothetical protein AAF483_27730, partial [Planctomycetota bacterium]